MRWNCRKSNTWQNLKYYSTVFEELTENKFGIQRPSSCRLSNEDSLGVCFTRVGILNWCAISCLQFPGNFFWKFNLNFVPIIILSRNRISTLQIDPIHNHAKFIKFGSALQSLFSYYGHVIRSMENCSSIWSNFVKLGMVIHWINLQGGNSVTAQNNTMQHMKILRSSDGPYLLYFSCWERCRWPFFAITSHPWVLNDQSFNVIKWNNNQFDSSIHLIT